MATGAALKYWSCQVRALALQRCIRASSPALSQLTRNISTSQPRDKLNICKRDVVGDSRIGRNWRAQLEITKYLRKRCLHQESPSVAPVVKLKGLPWSTTPEDIVKFFENVKVKNGTDGVHIKMQLDGRPSGEAFVELETLEDRKASLALCGEYLGTRYVEVYDSSYPVMKMEIGQASQQSSSTSVVIRLLGLPWSTTTAEIMEFLKDVKVKNGTDGVHIKMQLDGRPSGEAFVELETLEDREASLALSGLYVGTRSVKVFDSSYPVMENEIGQAIEDGEGCVVRLRGLPYGTTDDVIRSFLQGIAIEAITIQISENSKQTGEAFVVLGNPDDADKALDRHTETIGARYIEVFRSTYKDIVPVVYSHNGRRGGSPYNRGPPRNYPSRGGHSDNGIRRRGGGGSGGY